MITDGGAKLIAHLCGATEAAHRTNASILPSLARRALESALTTIVVEYYSMSVPMAQNCAAAIARMYIDMREQSVPVGQCFNADTIDATITSERNFVAALCGSQKEPWRYSPSDAV